MKINPEYVLRNIAGEQVVVPTGKVSRYFNGLITMNEVAQFIWEHVDQAESREALAALVVENFNVEDQVALRDVNGFLDMLKQYEILLED